MRAWQGRWSRQRRASAAWCALRTCWCPSCAQTSAPPWPLPHTPPCCRPPSALWPFAGVAMPCMLLLLNALRLILSRVTVAFRDRSPTDARVRGFFSVDATARVLSSIMESARAPYLLRASHWCMHQA